MFTVQVLYAQMQGPEVLLDSLRFSGLEIRMAVCTERQSGREVS